MSTPPDTNPEQRSSAAAAQDETTEAASISVEAQPNAAESTFKLPASPVIIPQSEGKSKVFEPEVEFGNVEYKLKLIDTTDERIEHLASQMKWRIGEGNGEAFYEIGVENGGNPKGLTDDELSKSIANLMEVARRAGAVCNVLRVTDGLDGKVADVLVRSCADDGNYLEIRVAVVGNVDAGKSTTLGVLTHSVLDNGRGKARVNVFRHQHEVDTGRTSSVCTEIMGFDESGKVINYDLHGTHTQDIVKQSCKIINFSDLAGHEKYFKTTLFGMTGHSPDYVMLMVGANMGCVGMTKEHLGCALALRVPVFVVITKIDIAPENVYKETLSQIQKMLKSPGVKKIPTLVKNEDDVIVSARQISSGRVTPIFCISNVTGKNVDLLRKFLNLLSSTQDWATVANEPVQFVIDNDWAITGVGTVASGTVMRGTLTSGETLLLGPNEFGQFTPVQVKSVHTNRLPVRCAKAGMTASVSIKKLERKQLRKGMILVHPSLRPTACLEFDAEVVILYHSTTMTLGYEAVVHCGAVRQTARLVKLDRAHLRTGDKATITFRFLYYPEFLMAGSRIIFREGRAKGIGRVVATTPYIHVPATIKGGKKRSSSDPSLLLTSFPAPVASTAPVAAEAAAPNARASSEEIEESDNVPPPVRGYYVRNMETDKVRAVLNPHYTLLENEEFWTKEIPLEMEELITVRRGRKPNGGVLRDKTQIVSVSFPHSSAVKIVNTRTKAERVVFSNQQCYLEPYEMFHVFALSGGRPKRPNQKRSIRMILNPSFMTDIFPCTTLDSFGITLKLSYNYRFDVDPASCSQEDALAVFSIPDFVGHVCTRFNAEIQKSIAGKTLAEFAVSAVDICEDAVFGKDRKPVTLENRLLITTINMQNVEGDEKAKKVLATLPPILTSKQARQKK